jgi:serine/threonine protein kinase
MQDLEDADRNTMEYEDLRWLIDREIQIMSTLDHPHIIHLEEVYEDDDRVYFILELAKVRSSFLEDRRSSPLPAY